MTNTDAPATAHQQDPDDRLDAILAAAHGQLGIAVTDRINAQGGPPELRPPDLALDRLLAATHRKLGDAVGNRLARAARSLPTQRNEALAGPAEAGGALFRRAPSLRVKYRAQTLRLAATYWPFDLAQTLRDCMHILQGLCDELAERTDTCRSAGDAVETVRSNLDRLTRLPVSYRTPSAMTGMGYLDAVESVLAHHAERILSGVQEIQDLLEEELAPTVANLSTTGSEPLLGVDTVAQDMIDDLAQSSVAAGALAVSVAEVERASNDFLGADLSNAQLEGVRLEGILWDAATIWPEEWETRVRRASRMSRGEEGVLVVAAEGSNTAVHAEA